MSSLRKRKRDSNWIRRRKDKDKINDDDNTTIKPNLIDVLAESLLLFEIFSKLRNPKDVIVCKSVSKKWNTLISSSSIDQTPKSVLILNTNPQCVISNTCVETWKGFELSKYIEPDFDSPVCVLASDKDILLCMKSSSSPQRIRSQFYIVNPLTMQWTRLPKTKEVISIYPIGLLGNESMDRFYVVNLVPTLSPSTVGFHVLDSKYGQWRHVWIEHPPWSDSECDWCPTQLQALNFNGALHWLAHDGPIVGYNPNNKDECKIIHRSQEMRHSFYGDGAVVSEILTVSKLHLRIIQLVCYPFPEDRHHLRIWTLEDYKQSIWRQEHDPLYFKDMISDIPWIQDYMQRYNLMTTDKHSLEFVMTVFMYLSDPDYNRQRIISPQPLHCDPNNPLVVYLYLQESIVSIDVTTKKLRLITRVTNSDQNRGFLKSYDKVIPMTLRFDPTLVPYHECKFLPHHKKTSG